MEKRKNEEIKKNDVNEKTDLNKTEEKVIGKKDNVKKQKKTKSEKKPKKGEGAIDDLRTIPVIEKNEEEKKKVEIKEKNNIEDNVKMKEKEELNIMFAVVQGWTIIALTLFILVAIFLTGSLWGLFAFLLVGISLYSIKEYKKISDGEKKFMIIVLTIISLLLVGVIPLILAGQKGLIRLQNVAISSIGQKNVQLKQNINDTMNQMVQMNEKYKKEIIQLKKEKLNYGETVKNKTIDIIIDNLKYFKKQNISNIDISKKNMTRQEMKQKMIEEKKQNWSYNLEN